MNRCEKYHIDTSHTYESLQKPRYINWNDYPSPWKVYKTLTFKLPPFSTENSTPMTKVLFNSGNSAKSTLSLKEVSSLCFAMNGITKVEMFDGEPFMFRSTPSAGALYPFELYLFIKNLPVPDGIYHYQPLNHSLELLSQGNYSEEIESIFCIKLNSNVFPFISFIHPRTVWKYGKRGYRYCLLDCGHFLSNGVLFLKSIGKKATVISKFCDEKINTFMKFDETEFVIAAINIGELQRISKNILISPINSPEHSKIANEPIIDSEIVEVHREGNTPSCKSINPKTKYLPEQRKVPSEIFSLPLTKTILKRRSRRNFKAKTLKKDIFLLAVETLNASLDVEWTQIAETVIITNNIENIPDGIYKLKKRNLTLLKPGNFSKEMIYLSLGQPFVGKANFNVIFYTNLSNINCHNYRRFLLESGIQGEKLYLLLESINLGACGVGAFLDFELKKFLNLCNEEYPVYIVSCGTT